MDEWYAGRTAWWIERYGKTVSDGRRRFVVQVLLALANVVLTVSFAAEGSWWALPSAAWTTFIGYSAADMWDFYAECSGNLHALKTEPGAMRRLIARWGGPS